MKTYTIAAIASLAFAWVSPSFARADAPAKDPCTPPNFPVPTFDASKTYEVKDFGATGDGTTNDTPAIDKAIAKCSDGGGGIVHFPAGTYLVASVHLKSNVELLLDKQAVITGAKTGYDSPEPNPYDKYQDRGHSHFHTAVMWGENLENFAIVGGKINGGGTTQSDKYADGSGDKVISVRVGKNLLFKDVTHDTGGHFVYLLNDCTNVTVDHVIIKKSRDAIDFMSCSNVQVHNCNFTGCVDDTIGVKSDYALGRKIKSENIYVWDSYFESGCNGVQFGSETAGDFYNVNFWNIKIGKAFKAGIGITTNDGGIIDNVHYRDFTISGAANPIFVLITRRLRTGEPDAKPGTIRNVTIDNVKVTNVVPGRQGQANPATISGLPESHLQNIILNNVKITYKGGGKKDDVNIVPPYPKDYSPKSMGTRPAAGFYIRHVDNLQFHNVSLMFEAPDERPPLVADDVNGFELDHFSAQKVADVPTMWLQHIKDLNLHDSPPLKDTKEANVEDAKY